MKKLKRWVRLPLRSWTRLSKKAKRRMVMLLAFVAVLFLLIHLATEPVHGRTFQTPVSEAKLEKLVPRQSTSPTTPASTLGNAYFSLSLPAGYQVQANNPTVSGLLFSQTIIKTSGEGTLLLNVSVASLPSGGLSGDTSYTYRTQQPAKYQMSSLSQNSDVIEIAAALQDDGVVAFWPHGQYLATMSAASGFETNGGGSTLDELQAVKGLVGSWRWK